MLAKSFIIIAKSNMRDWYLMLKPSSMYSWEDLHDKILANFKGFISESLTSMDLFQYKQNQGEALKDYFQKFVQMKAKAPNVLEDVVIEAAIKGLPIRPFAAYLAREKPRTIEDLYSEFEKYCRSKNYLCRRLEDQN